MGPPPPSSPVATVPSDTSGANRPAKGQKVEKLDVEESKTDRRLPSLPLPHKTATWPAQSHDLAITQTLLQNVKDISPHISAPQSPHEHHATFLRPHLKLPSWHFI